MCQGNSTNCLKCVEPLKLMEITLECVIGCPAYYYEEILTSTCRSCSSLCLQCTDEFTCLVCEKGYFVDLYGNCSQCNSDCKTCDISADQCTSCNLGYYLTQLQECKRCSNICSQCVDSEENCLFCAKNYYKQYDTGSSFQCVSVCNDGYFGSTASGNCSKCTTQCEDCKPDSISIRPQNDGCRSSKCRQGLFKYGNDCRRVVDPVKGGICKPCNTTICSKCITDQICKTCVKGYYLNPLQWCSKCQSSCLECTDYSECQICQSGYLLQEGFCVQECSQGFFEDGLNCSKCSLGCSQCIGRLYNQCNSCMDTHQLFTSECLIKCDPGQYRDTDRICKLCLNGCKYCTNNNSCSTCFSGYFLTGQEHTCSSCNRDCIECRGPLQTDCTNCPNTKILFKGQCISQCPINYFYTQYNNQCSPCSDSGCEICLNANQCSKCKDRSEFLIDNSQCIDICPNDHENWQSNNVDIYGNVYIQKNCLKIQCLQGFKQEKDKCIEVCGDGFIKDHPCDDGNLIDGDGCNSMCRIENNFECLYSLQAQKSICSFLFSYTLQKGQKFNQIIIIMNTPITNYQDIFQIQQTSLDQSRYSYTITPELSNQNYLTITFDYTVQVPYEMNAVVSINQSIKIKFSNYQSGTPYKLTKQTDSIKFNSQYIPDYQQQSQQIASTTRVVSQSVLASFIPMSFIGGINFVTKVVDISQLIYLHIFIDVKYPYGTKLFLQSFQDFQIPFIINPFQLMFPDDFKRESFESFTRNEIYATFLMNAGDQLSTLAIIFIAHQSIRLLVMKFTKLSAYVSHLFVYGIYAEAIMSIYLEVIFAIFLQFTNMDTEITGEYVNQIIMGITAVTLIPMPFLFAYYFKKKLGFLHDKSFKSKFGFFWEGTKEGDYYSMIFNIYLHLRKIFFALVIVFLNFNPIAQCFLLCIPTFLLGLFVFLHEPFVEKLENSKQVIQEILFSLGSISIMVLKCFDDVPEKTRNLVSIPIIVFFFLILLMHSIATLVQIIKVIRVYHLLTKVKQLVQKCISSIQRKRKESQFSVTTLKSNQINPEKQQIDKIQFDNNGLEDDLPSINFGNVTFKAEMKKQSAISRQKRNSIMQTPQISNSPTTTADITQANYNLDNYNFESNQRMIDKRNSQIKDFKSFESLTQVYILKQQKNKEDKEDLKETRTDISNLNIITDQQLYNSKDSQTPDEKLIIQNNGIPKSQFFAQDKEIFNNDLSFKQSENFSPETNNKLKYLDKEFSIVDNIENEDDFNLNKQPRQDSSIFDMYSSGYKIILNQQFSQNQIEQSKNEIEYTDKQQNNKSSTNIEDQIHISYELRQSRRFSNIEQHSESNLPQRVRKASNIEFDSNKFSHLTENKQTIQRQRKRSQFGLNQNSQDIFKWK